MGMCDDPAYGDACGLFSDGVVDGILQALKQRLSWHYRTL
jgi:hypothetical protein